MFARAEAGEKIDSKNIKKHRNDVLRLTQLLPGDASITLTEAVSQQEAIGLRGKAARRAALAENPSLAAAFAGKTDGAIVKAIARHAKDQK